MSATSPIEWTDATWNPIVGCSIVSPGCTHCYAMRHAARIERMNPGSHYDGTTKKVNGNTVWTGKLALAPDHILHAPLSWRKPKRIFVNSMGDLFHEDVPEEAIDRVFAVMALTPQHTYQVLTKRGERMRNCVNGMWARREALGNLMMRVGGENAKGWYAPESDGKRGWVGMHMPLPNVWLGVSAEDQTRADERIPHLLQTPAAVRFVSIEPLLGPISLDRLAAPEKVEGEDWRFSALTTGDMYEQRIERTFDGPYYDSGDGPYRDAALDWVIVGGESGFKARPMHADWARSLRDQCAAAGVPFFFKQWGAWRPHKPQAGGDLGGDVRRGSVRIVHPTGQSDVEVAIATAGRNTIPGSRYMARVGKKAAGRLLDGVEHNAMPVRT